VDTIAKDMYYSEDDFQVADAVAAVAKQRGVSAAQMACAWVLQAPGVTAPIIGATKTQHLKDLIASVDLKLSADEVAALEKPYGRTKCWATRSRPRRRCTRKRRHRALW
jgi:aryl-alcohol dehydrogenase-like predicted oxidoreductase